MTPLDKPVRREIVINDQPYTLVIDPEGLSLSKKGHRRRIRLLWTDLVSGDAALAVALKATVEEL